MKKTLLTLAALLYAACVLAWTPRFSYGLEWGYTGTFLRTRQHNYIYSEGARIIDNSAVWWYYSNGAVLANAGADLTNHLNLSVYSGLLGVYSRRWMVPVELRARWCPSGLASDGFIAHTGAALVFPTTTLKETAVRLNIGAGYRFLVYKHISVDFLASFNLTSDHDQIRDPDTNEYVPRSKVSSNLSEYWGVNIGAALNF